MELRSRGYHTENTKFILMEICIASDEMERENHPANLIYDHRKYVHDTIAGIFKIFRYLERLLYRLEVHS